MKVYVTRNKNDIEDDRVFVWDRKPSKIDDYDGSKLDSNIDFRSSYDPLFSYHYRTFKKYFKFIPKKGTCKEMDLKIEN